MLKVGLPLLAKHRDRWNRKRQRAEPRARELQRLCSLAHARKRAENPTIAERHKRNQLAWWNRNKDKYLAQRRQRRAEQNRSTE